MIFRGVQVGERDIATAYDPSLVYEDYVGEYGSDAKRYKKMHRKIRQRKNKSTSPMEDKDRKQAEKDAIEEKKREARELKMKEKIRERRRIERAKQRARRRKMRPKVFCECKAREFKIIEARRNETLGSWNTWCPPDPAPEADIVYDAVAVSPEDLASPPPPIAVEMRDLMIQIDLPPIEPGTALSEEMFDIDELDAMGSVQEFERSAFDRLSTVSSRVRRSIAGVVVASSLDKSIRPLTPRVSKTPRPRPRSMNDTKPKPKPRVREIVMQTDSDPGPLREQNIQYEKQCVCQPGPDSKCTCKRDGEGDPCSCRTPSPLDGGPPCICKPRFGPGFRTKRRKKCKSRKCKKCREQVLSGRDKMARTRTKDEKIKEEQEKIRIEKAKLKAMKQVQKREGKINRHDLATEKIEMKAAADRLKEQMREQESKLKEQKRRELAREKRLKAQVKEQRKQAARDEDFRRRLSEMRKPEAEFCGCKDWQKGLCRIKIPPDIEAAREALLREQNASIDKSHGGQTMAMTVTLARSVDNSDSEFILPTHRQPGRKEALYKSQYKVDNYVANATISRDQRDSVFDITNRLSVSENDVGEARYLNNDLLGSRGKELRSWYDDMRITCSSSFRGKSYSPQRQLKQNITQHNTATTKSAYPRRRCSTPPAVATTNTAASSKVNKNVSLAKTKQQSTRRRRIPEDDVPTTALNINNDIITPKINNKDIRPRNRPVYTNVAETVFTRSNDETGSTVDMIQSILTQQNDSSTSKSGLHRFVEKVLSKKRKDRSKERFRHEIQRNYNQVKGIQGTGTKAKLDKNRGIPADKFPQGSIKMMNSRFMKRKFAKNIVTSLISIFNNSSCRMPKGASSVMPAQLADSSIAEEPYDSPTCGRALFAADSAATSVAERPGLHVLGSPPPARRVARLRDQTR